MLMDGRIQLNECKTPRTTTIYACRLDINIPDSQTNLSLD